MKQCPHCENSIYHLKYTISAVEYGTANLVGDIEDTQGTDSCGSYEYACPECDEEVDPEDLIDEDESDETLVIGSSSKVSLTTDPRMDALAIQRKHMGHLYAYN